MNFDNERNGQMQAHLFDPSCPLAAAYSLSRAHILEKYNCSQAYTEIQAINRLLHIPSNTDRGHNKNDLDQIILNDLKFDECEEYIEQLYESKFEAQLSELFQYYKYYLQDPVICFTEQYDIMHRYYERRKGHVYNQLKKILTLSEVDDGKESKAGDESSILSSNMKQREKEKEKMKKNKMEKKAILGLENILAEISLNKTTENEGNADESLHFQELKKKLIKYYGPPSTKSMQIIDSIYNFNKVGSENFTLKSSKKFYHCGNGKRQVAEKLNYNFKKDSTRILESTNISTSQKWQNEHTFKESSTRVNNVRKRSTRRYKSTGNSQDGQLLPITSSHGQVSKIYQNQKKKLKVRRKSTDLMQNTIQWERRRPLMNTEACESKHEQLKKFSRKKRQCPKSGKPESLELADHAISKNMLDGTIAKLKRKIKQEKEELKRIGSGTGQIKMNNFLRTASNNNFSHHSKKTEVYKTNRKPKRA